MASRPLLRKSACGSSLFPFVVAALVFCSVDAPRPCPGGQPRGHRAAERDLSASPGTEIRRGPDGPGGGSNLRAPAYHPPPQQNGGSDLLAQLLTRVDALEEQVRQLRGRIDETQNQLQQQNADLGKRIDDLAFQINPQATQRRRCHTAVATQPGTAAHAAGSATRSASCAPAGSAYAGGRLARRRSRARPPRLPHG